MHRENKIMFTGFLMIVVPEVVRLLSGLYHFFKNTKCITSSYGTFAKGAQALCVYGLRRVFASGIYMGFVGQGLASAAYAQTTRNAERASPSLQPMLTISCFSLCSLCLCELKKHPYRAIYPRLASANTITAPSTATVPVTINAASSPAA